VLVRGPEQTIRADGDDDPARGLLDGALTGHAKRQTRRDRLSHNLRRSTFSLSPSSAFWIGGPVRSGPSCTLLADRSTARICRREPLRYPCGADRRTPGGDAMDQCDPFRSAEGTRIRRPGDPFDGLSTCSGPRGSSLSGSGVFRRSCSRGAHLACQLGRDDSPSTGPGRTRTQAACDRAPAVGRQKKRFAAAAEGLARRRSGRGTQGQASSTARQTVQNWCTFQSHWRGVVSSGGARLSQAILADRTDGGPVPGEPGFLGDDDPRVGRGSRRSAGGCRGRDLQDRRAIGDRSLPGGRQRPPRYRFMDKCRPRRLKPGISARP